MSQTKLTPIDKAAIILASVGDELAIQILSQFNVGEVKKLASALQRLGRVDADIVNEVVGEFLETLQQKSPKNQSKFGLSAGALQRFMEKALSHKNDELVKSIIDSQYQMRIFDRTKPETLAKILSQERPQTIALVLAHADAQTASLILKTFPERLKTEILLSLARLQTVNLEVLQDLDDQLIKAAEAMMSSPALKKGGINKVAAILNYLEPENKDLLTRLDSKDAALGQAIRHAMFTFDDLIWLDSKAIQQLLKKIDQQTLAIALRGASSTIQRKFLDNVSTRTARLLEDEIAIQRKASDVSKARQDILKIADQCIKDGVFQLQREEKKPSGF